GRADLMLLLPAFGLMLTGFASVAVNGVKTVEYLRDPAAAAADFAAVQKQWGAADAERVAAENAGTIRAVIAACAVIGVVEFYAGLAMVLRRHYRMAQVGCV